MKEVLDMLARVLIPIFDSVTYNNELKVWNGKIKFKKFGEIEVAEDQQVNGSVLYTKLFDLQFDKIKLFNGLEILRDNVLDEIPDGTISSVLLRALEDPVDVIKYKIPFYLFDEIFKDTQELQQEFSLSLKTIKEQFDLVDFTPTLGFFFAGKQFNDNKHSFDAPTEQTYLTELYQLHSNSFDVGTMDKLTFGKAFKFGDIPISNISAFSLFNGEPIKQVEIDAKFQGKINELKRLDREFYFNPTNELVIKPSYLMVKYNCFLNLPKSNELNVSAIFMVKPEYGSQFEGITSLGGDKYSMRGDLTHEYKELDRFKLLLDAAALRSSYDLAFFGFKNKSIDIQPQQYDTDYMHNLPNISDLKAIFEDPMKMMSFLLPAL